MASSHLCSGDVQHDRYRGLQLQDEHWPGPGARPPDQEQTSCWPILQVEDGRFDLIGILVSKSLTD